jgi:hypothetical protein
MSYKKQEQLIIRRHLGSLHVLGRVRVAHDFSLLCCVFALFVYVLCIVCPMLAVSQDCPFLITSSVFYDVYFLLNEFLYFHQES